MSTARPIPVLFLAKSHIDTYTRKDGAVVRAHDDKRQAAVDDSKFPDGPGRKGFKPGQHVTFPHPKKPGEKATGRFVGVRDGQSVVHHDEHGELKLDHADVTPDRGAQDVDKNDDGDLKDWRDETNWHTRTMGRMKTLGEAQLHYIVKDAREAAKHAWDMGNHDKAGKYEDEAHYAAMELHKRSAPVREAKAKYDAEMASGAGANHRPAASPGAR